MHIKIEWTDADGHHVREYDLLDGPYIQTGDNIQIPGAAQETNIIFRHPPLSEETSP